jgi:hypothetical protein
MALLRPTHYVLHSVHQCQNWAGRLLAGYGSGVWSVIKKNNCSLWEYCNATVKSEAIACARRCWSSWLTGWWTRQELSEKWRAYEEERHKMSLTHNSMLLVSQIFSFLMYIPVPNFRHFRKPSLRGTIWKLRRLVFPGWRQQPTAVHLQSFRSVPQLPNRSFATNKKAHS